MVLICSAADTSISREMRIFFSCFKQSKTFLERHKAYFPVVFMYLLRTMLIHILKSNILELKMKKKHWYYNLFCILPCLLFHSTTRKNIFLTLILNKGISYLQLRNCFKNIFPPQVEIPDLWWQILVERFLEVVSLYCTRKCQHWV